ncbi:helix-turn-helix transcriptional regulator [Bacillus sp. MUM 13]|uniref:helix-turn-helix domain-containing protein n=1 Tax=Bacillus sp. MUM 13 TaxID=1678001 RepID=UPI0008F5786C|nr:helix-turn-helix transcriptional regulator [Bacillus sp. MUM 13]OIK08808.1 hypothetical protein BIV59_18665 [Bacillus sp. MUM 13]
MEHSINSPIRSFSFKNKKPTKPIQRNLLLGNKIKELRTKNNLKHKEVASFVGISDGYSRMIENGTKMPIKEKLEKFEEFYKLEPDTLTQLRDLQQKEPFQEIETAKSIYDFPDYIQSIVTALSSIDDEEFCRQKAMDFLKELHEDYFTRLTPYEWKEVKKQVLLVKRAWNTGIDKTNIENANFQGYVIQDEHKIFFFVEVDEHALSLNLLYNERHNAKLFESWLGVSSVQFITSMQLPFLKEEQKITRWLWFHPTVSIVNMYKYLQENGVNIQNVDINEPRLSWYIKEMTFDQGDNHSAM